MGAGPGGGFAVNVFLRDGDTVHRTWHTDGRGTEQLSHTFPLVDVLPWGRQEEWQDSPEGWPKSPTYSKRSEEHTSELQSLMRNSYAVFCLKKKHRSTTY